jgi:hypothetical protein
MVFRPMKNRIYIDGKSYLRLLLLVPAISLAGLAGSSSADARPGQEFQAGLIGRIDTHPNDDERVVGSRLKSAIAGKFELRETV